MIDKRKRKLKFLTLYNSFSQKEKSEFRNYFLKSNLSTSHRDYNRILSSMKINDRGIIDIDGNYNNTTRWNRFSELNLLAENFLLHKSIESESITKNGLLLKEFDRKKLPSPFRQKYMQLKKEISKVPFVNYDYNIISQLDKINLKNLKKNSRPEKLEKIFIETYNFRLGTFLFELLELMIEVNTRRKSKILVSDFIAEEIFSGLNIEKILTYLSDKSNSSNKLYPLIRFLYSLYLCDTEISERKSYLTAKKVFFRDLKSLNKEKRTIYYTYLINYNIDLLNNSIPGADKELFFLMNKKLKEGLIDDLKERNLYLNKFRNYIIIGINLKKYSWVSEIIKNYGAVLPSTVKENDILMGKSLLLFAKKNFVACNVLLGQIKKISPYYFIDVSVLKLKTLYELKNIDECHTELKKFKEYLRKDRIVNDHIIYYSKEFLRAFALLLKLNQNPSANNLNNLQYLLSKKNFIAKKWINAKAEEVRI